MKNKVTESDLKDLIAKVEYHRLTKRMTVCVMTLKSGFEVLGMSACVDVKNYNQAKGESVAYENAFDQLWELQGYYLMNQLNQ